MSGLPWIDAATIEALLPMGDAIDVIEATLAAGLDTSADPARSVVPIARGQLLLMPSETPGAVGVKVVALAPANPPSGCPASRPCTCC
jgi:ornithine cyclodeaminase